MHTVSHIIMPEIYSYRRHNTSTVSVTQEAFTNCLFLALYIGHTVQYAVVSALVFRETAEGLYR